MGRLGSYGIGLGLRGGLLRGLCLVGLVGGGRGGVGVWTLVRCYGVGEKVCVMDRMKKG